jgi:hypothetical protein
VTAENGSIAVYTVTVSIALNSAKAITSYSFAGPEAVGVIDESAKTISATVPFGTDVTGLVSSFTTSAARVTVGDTLQASGTTPNNFSQPVQYTVTAEDGSVAVYTVTVSVSLNSAKAITSYSFASPPATGMIDQTAKTISVTLPYGTDVTGLVASFTTSGAHVTVGDALQASGTTQNDFSGPVEYLVAAEDGSTAAYMATVAIAAAPADVLCSAAITVAPDDLRKVLSASGFPGLELNMGMKKTAYGTSSNCVPTYVEIVNNGIESVTLSTVQADLLSKLSNAIYAPGSLMSEAFVHSSGKPITAGSTIFPGERIILGSLFSRDRITLYSVPPLGGGIVTRTLDIQGPFGASGAIGIAGLDLTFDLDFGSLPLSRVYDPGAGTSFKEGELIVGFKPGTTPAEKEALVARHGCHIAKNISSLVLSLSIPFDKTTGAMIAEFATESSVSYSERNGIVSQL